MMHCTLLSPSKPGSTKTPSRSLTTSTTSALQVSLHAMSSDVPLSCISLPMDPTWHWLIWDLMGHCVLRFLRANRSKCNQYMLPIQPQASSIIWVENTTWDVYWVSSIQEGQLLTIFHQISWRLAISVPFWAGLSAISVQFFLFFLPILLNPLCHVPGFQKALKEKEEHIEQLLREHDLERAEFARASLNVDEVSEFLTLQYSASDNSCWSYTGRESSGFHAVRNRQETSSNWRNQSTASIQGGGFGSGEESRCSSAGRWKEVALSRKSTVSTL